jgi:hypothetical protein
MYLRPGSMKLQLRPKEFGTPNTASRLVGSLATPQSAASGVRWGKSGRELQKKCKKFRPESVELTSCSRTDDELQPHWRRWDGPVGGALTEPSPVFPLQAAYSSGPDVPFPRKPLHTWLKRRGAVLWTALVERSTTACFA